MMRQNSYLRLREAEQNLMMMETCGATNCTMMEVGRAISIMMKVCEVLKVLKVKVSCYLIMSVVIYYMRRFIS